MIRLSINSKLFEVPEGSTILEIARNAGIKIPTLCHRDGLPHYSSCMVCMIKDNRTNSFLPSCTALVQEGMELITNDEEVISLRKKAIELILSEHRAECEAPCRIVCPAGYNIPLMNRFLAANDFESAIKLSLSQLDSSDIICTDCPGYCENACRRKKIDLPVSIRNIQLFVYQSVSGDKKVYNTDIEGSNNISTSGSKLKSGKISKKFSSRTGKLDAKELTEWLKECNGKGTRFREISMSESAASESENCMHCDCRAADDCRLRDLADEFLIKDPRGKLINAPIVKKINQNTGLVFENAKCIKCGLCVRVCEDSKDEPALCFINRGFISIISEPLTEEFDNILKTKSNEVIEVCPTGALSKLN